MRAMPNECLRTYPVLALILSLIPVQLAWGTGSSASAMGFSGFINSSSDPADSTPDPMMTNATVAPKKEDTASDRHFKESGGPSVPGIPAQWQSCKVDSDCTAAVADCMSWNAVNKKYLKKLDGNLRSCSTDIDPGFEPVVVCAQGMCVPTDKTTDVPWADWLQQTLKNKKDD